MELPLTLAIVVAVAYFGITSSNETKPGDIVDKPEVGVQNVTAHFCPFMCTVGNQTLCYPPPCPLPPCVDRKKMRPTDCCEYCPNGPDCAAPEGKIIKYNHWEIIDGKNCTCTMPPGNATCV